MHQGIIVFSGLVPLLSSLVSAQEQLQERQFYRWTTPGADVAGQGELARRQGPLPGYHPEFGTCGSGTTCENACGPNWLSCDASTTLSLFCYNKADLNQTCCENGSGRKFLTKGALLQVELDANEPRQK